MRIMDNSLAKRWITGIILIVAILFIIFYTSAEILGAVIIAIIIGGMWEFNNIVFGRGFLKEKAQTFIFAFVIPLIFLFGDNQLIVAVLAFCVMIVFIMFLWQVNEENFDIIKIMKVMFGIIYIPFLMSHFILLRKLPNGEWWVMFVLVLALIGDTAALYVGKYFGRKKLLALVSPGKTVEGMIALVCGSVLACLIYVYFFMPQIPVHHVLFLAFFGSVIGQLGDLCESAIKRSYGQKDASSLLPGHGGLLDRMDCLLFIAPFVYYYYIFVIA